MNHRARNILITGVSSDLGMNLYEHVCNDGSYNVLSTSRKTINVDIGDKRNMIHLSGLDLTNENNLKSLAEVAIDFFKEQFSVVHFAGDFWQHKPLIDTSYEEIKRMMSSHYFSLCGVAHAITPIMMRKGGGRLVAFSCNSVGYNYPDLSPFTSAKAAVESFIKCYSNEYSPYNISSTVLALPTMRTRKVLDEKPQGDTENYIEPDELSKIILDEILCLSNHITGNVTRVIKYSKTFYNNGYFERNPRTKESAQIMANNAINSDS